MSEKKDKLVVVWSSGDRDVALKVAFMYTINSKKKGWWNEVTLVVWGPSAELLSRDKALQDYLADMRNEGVVLEACVSCADMYGVSDTLRGMGIDVKKMGMPLTEYIKEGCGIITF